MHVSNVPQSFWEEIKADNARWIAEAARAGMPSAIKGLSIKDWPIEEVREYRDRLDREGQLKQVVRASANLRPIKPYRPQSLIVKFRRRCSNLRDRARKRFSFPDFWIDYVLSEVAAKAWNYGCCQIAGDRCSTPDYGQVLRHQQAIAREQELRARGL